MTCLIIVGWFAKVAQKDFVALGLSANASLTEAKRAFRTLAQAQHPDKKSGSTAAFLKLQKAYESVIKDIKDRSPTQKRHTVSTTSSYDPFTDSDYDQRIFFEPDSPRTEGFERTVRAKGCPYCGGIGKITKNIHPEKGFMGRETRLCRCQWQ